jgi:taurine transport system substrate-binding protein
MKASAKITCLIGVLVSVALMIQVIEVPLACAQEKTVRIGWMGGPRPWIIGKATGMFEKGMGVKIQWVQFPSGAAAISALGAGAVDISRLGSPPTVASISRGVEIYQIAVSGAIATSERLVAKKSIPNITALEGKSIAYPPGSTAHYALLAALKVNNVPVGKTKLLSMSPADMSAAWMRGDIDAAFVWGPFSHQMEENGGHQLLATKDLRKDSYYVWNCYVTRKEFADKNPELVEKFLRVFQENVQMYKSDTKKWVDFIAKELDQKPEAVADTMAGLEYPTFQEQLTPAWFGDSKTKEDAALTKAMMDIGRFLVDLGDLPKGSLPKSFAPYNNTTFMEKIARSN